MSKLCPTGVLLFVSARSFCAGCNVHVVFVDKTNFKVIIITILVINTYTSTLLTALSFGFSKWAVCTIKSIGTIRWRYFYEIWNEETVRLYMSKTLDMPDECSTQILLQIRFKTVCTHKLVDRYLTGPKFLRLNGEKAYHCHIFHFCFDKFHCTIDSLRYTNSSHGLEHMLHRNRPCVVRNSLQ